MLIVEVPVSDGRPLELRLYYTRRAWQWGEDSSTSLIRLARVRALCYPRETPATDWTSGVLGRLMYPWSISAMPMRLFVPLIWDVLGLSSYATIDANTELSRILERIRAHAGVAMGMIDDPEKAAKVSPATPFVAMVAPPQDYENVIGGNNVTADESQFVASHVHATNAQDLRWD